MKDKGKVKICCPYCNGIGYRHFESAELKELFKDNKNSEKRTQAILALRKSGLTYKKIADRFDMTRQRVHQIVKDNLIS